MEGFRKGLKKTRIFQPKYYTKESKYITYSQDVKDYYKIHLFYLTRQITFVDDEINIALVKGKHIPRKPTQWVKEATALKSQVNDALKEEQSGKNDELNHLSEQMFDCLRHCPVEGKHDEPITFIAGLHKIQDNNKSCSESVLQSEDNASVPKTGTDLMLHSESKCGNEDEGESSQAFDYNIPEITLERFDQFEITKVDEASIPHEISPPYITDIQIQETNEPENWAKLNMSVEISENLKFEFLSSSSSKENVGISFGLDSERDNYLLTSTKIGLKPELDYQRSCEGSNEMPTAEEWRKAGVMNLSGRSSLFLNEGPDCPNLVHLFLQRNNSLNHIPSSFFARMPALRVLDLSYTRIRDLPASLFKLEDLKVLMLRSCVCLESLPIEVQNLRKMQVLDLSSTDLYYLPKEIGELRRLKHLHLSFYGSDYGSGYARLPSEILSPGIFSEMKDLESLSIVVHPEDQRWIKIAGDIIERVKRLENLSSLEFYFPTVEALNSFVSASPSWSNQRTRRFKFIVGHNVKRIISRVPDEVESKYDRLDQCLRFINGSHVVHQVMKRVLKSVKAFYLDHHLDIQDLSEFGIFNFVEVEFCVVRECPNFQVMMIGEKSSDESAFPNLQHLEMHYLWELERIWEDPVPSGSFKALRYLVVDMCPKLEYIASQSMLQRLSNLETFIIEDCQSLKSIVKGNETLKSAEVTLLPRLKKLVLRHLPHLATLGRGLSPSDDVDISVQFCPNLILSPHPGRTKRRKFLLRLIIRTVEAVQSSRMEVGKKLK